MGLYNCYNNYIDIFLNLCRSTLAQGKRAGPITLRSVDRNYEVLIYSFFKMIFVFQNYLVNLLFCLFYFVY